jgi:hypothetical protein
MAEQRLTVGQLRQVLLRDMNYLRGGDGSDAVTMAAGMVEVEEAVRELETEGLVQYLPRTQTIVVRTAMI